MKAFVLVHSLEDLTLTCSELESYYLFHRKRSRDWRPVPLTGFWIDSFMAKFQPEYVEWHDESSRLVSTAISNSFGRPPLWTHCELEDSAVTELALVESFVANELSNSGRFVPVFNSDLPQSKVDREMKKLVRLFPDRIDSPLFQEMDTGRIMTAQQTWKAA